MPDLTPIENSEVFAHAAAIPRTWFEDCQVETEEWLVDKVVPVGSYTVIFGKRGTGKSFLALELVCCGATGRDFLGERCERFGSIYAVGEKKSKFSKRVVAWKLANGGAHPPPAVLFRWSTPNLLDAQEVNAFIAELIGLKPEFEERGAPLRMIVLDTLVRCLKTGSVSDPNTVGPALQSIQRIIDEAGVTVIPLAHVAKADSSNTAKGMGEWEDAADALIWIDREGNGALRKVTQTKQSDEADGTTRGFELKIVDVGEAANGAQVTSCVIQHVDLPDEQAGVRPPKLTATALTVRSALDRLLGDGEGVAVPACPGVRPGTMGVRMGVLRAKAYDIGLQSASEPPINSPQPEKNRWIEARKKAFQRGMDRLQESQSIRVEGDFVWPI